MDINWGPSPANFEHQWNFDAVTSFTCQTTATPPPVLTSESQTTSEAVPLLATRAPITASPVPTSAIDPALLDLLQGGCPPSSAPLGNDATLAANNSNSFTVLSPPSQLSRPDFLPLHTGLKHSSHALRNPQKSVIPARHRTKGRQLTGSEKRQAAYKSLLKQEKKRKIQDGINEIIRVRDAAIVELANRFSGGKDKSIRKQINCQTQYKKPRAVGEFNALVSLEAEKLNEEGGVKLTLNELQQRVQQKIEAKKFTDEDIKSAKKRLESQRELKTTGVRASNISASLDAKSSVEKISKEIFNLYERTNVVGMAFFVPGNIDDDFQNTFAQSKNAEEFVREALNMDPTTVMTKMCKWACAKSDIPVILPDNAVNVRAEIVRLVQAGLADITLEPKVKMSYEHYNSSIVKKHRVHIVGWPAGMDFECPSKIPNIGKLRTLRNALTIKTCKWERLTRDQQAACDSGEMTVVPEKARKTRSDKGTKRKIAIVEDEPSGADAGADAGQTSGRDKENQAPAAPAKGTKKKTKTAGTSFVQYKPKAPARKAASKLANKLPPADGRAH